MIIFLFCLKPPSRSSMAASEPRLPNELIDIALSFLTPVDSIQDRDLRETLKACCLAGSVMRGIARPLLFKHLLFTEFEAPPSDVVSSISDTTGDSETSTSSQGESDVEDAVAEAMRDSIIGDNVDEIGPEIPVQGHETSTPSTTSGLLDNSDKAMSLESPLEVFKISKFARLLSTTPEVGEFVRHLTLWFDADFAFAPTEWEAMNVIEQVVKTLSQLCSFSFVRGDPPHSRSQDVHWDDLEDGFRDSIIRIASLPTLESFDLSYGIMFPDAATFCRHFCNCSPKLKTLHFSCLAFSDPDPIELYPSDQPIPIFQPRISFLQLNFIESYVHGPAVVDMLFGKYSPFDISQLERIKITGIDAYDTWIDTILSKQKDQLAFMKDAIFYDFFRYAANDLPFRRIAQMQGFLHIKIEPSENWTNWLKTLPIRQTILDQLEDAESGFMTTEQVLHQIFELGGKESEPDLDQAKREVTTNNEGAERMIEESGV
ncbi:hypothetical protein DL96DRAFT_1627405 [Flagelloscypha sp. PMI_526]|nr:hypothetical protein DL96DRAFT_1627405 [Flagelloscypha sp. PMI_526]